MHFRPEPDNPRNILRVNDDGTEDPFAVIFDTDAVQDVVDSLNALMGIVGTLRTWQPLCSTSAYRARA